MQRTLRALLAVALALALSGCAASSQDAGSVPESATLVPAEAQAFVTLVTDESSAQWKNADRLLSIFPEARSSLLEEVRGALADESLTWADDVAPALGDELVVVVTAGPKVVVLVQPESQERLAALIAKSDDPLVQGAVEDWTALAETQADLAAYRAALARGTLDGVDSFDDAMTGLPADALVRGWVDLKALANELGSSLEVLGVRGELGVEWLAAALAAENDGVHLSLGVRTPDENGASYEPLLVDRVPADAVAVLSFGGTQGILDRVEQSVDVGEISKVLEETVGVSLDGLVDALSGEAVLYVRDSGTDVPEVTLVLAPPDVDETFTTVDTTVRRLAEQAGGQVRTRTDGGRTLNELTVEGLTVAYARLDDAVVVTTAPGGIADFVGDGAKLVDADAFTAAAESVELGERTRGFAYVDIDGLIPLVESLAGPGAVPAEARDVLETLDSFILQGSGDGQTTTLSGFLRVAG